MTQTDKQIRFIEKRWLAFALSIILVLGSLSIMLVRGFNFGIDFAGGIVMEVRFEAAPDIAQLRSNLLNVIPQVSIQEFGSEKDIMIRIGQQEGKKSLPLVEKVKATLGKSYQNIDYRRVDFVGPQVGRELIISGIIALCCAFVAILLYIWFRFEWQFGLGAIIALFHDVCIVLGFYSFMQIEFNLSSVAAILTIIGYSINDSVVIFDRIRENLRKFKKLAIEALLNRSINDNLARTLKTSGTTMIALLALVLLGGPVVQGFSLAVLIGVAVGTFSSIYVAAPVLLYIPIRKNNVQAQPA